MTHAAALLGTASGVGKSLLVAGIPAAGHSDAAYIDVGWRVLNFLRAYGSEEGSDESPGFGRLPDLVN